MLNTKSILIAFYSLIGIGSLYFVAFNGGSFVQLIFFALSVVSIMALLGEAGTWAKISALLFSCFIFLVMGYALIHNVAQLFLNSSFAILPAIVAPVLAFLALLTARSLLRPGN